MSPGPTLRRRELGAALKRLRQQVVRDDEGNEGKIGFKHQEIADLLRINRSRVSLIENGKVAPNYLELQEFCRRYKAPADVAASLEEMLEAANQRGWWQTFKLPAFFEPYVGLEADAVTMRSFDGEVIPGLMQTEEYNRATQEAAAHLARGVEIDRTVAVRRRRAQRLTGENPLSCRTIISEAALQRALGLGAVGIDQLRHLVQLSELDNVSIQVIPLAAGLHASLGGSFVALSFADDIAPPAVYQEYAAGGQVVEDSEIVDALSEAWEKLYSQALTPTESIRWIERVIAETEEGDDGTP